MVSFVFAGFFENLYNTLTGKVTGTNVSITVSGVNPVTIEVHNKTITGGSMNQPLDDTFLDIDTESNNETCMGGTTPVNATVTTLTNAILPKGNHSPNYGNFTSAQEEIYYCITQVPPDISSQIYSTPQD